MNTSRKTRTTGKRLAGLLAVLVCMFATVLFSAQVAYAAAGDTVSATADTSTVGNWSNHLTDGNGEISTQNIGRIWTDKTVATETVDLGNDVKISKDGADSDFIVALSALSSTSNLESSTMKPLDIVLVLDTSGSMADSIGTAGAYTETNNVNRFGTYYISDGQGGYERVYWKGNRNGHWEDQNGNTIEPIDGWWDDDPSHVQFYVYEEESVSRMSALKSAVDTFISSTEAENEKITSESLKHRIALVTFASGSNIRSDFTSDFTGMKSTVQGLSASGGTYSDEAMESAELVMNGGTTGGWRPTTYDGARDNAQKVVIFFTDGGPGGSNLDPFDDRTANATISAAANIKDAGVALYSIGVFEDAEPSVTNDEMNAYMNAVSSNYPDATSYTNLGTKAEGDFYKAASNSGELSAIFSEILDENLEAASAPTQVTEGNADMSGYITFTDQLGDYMAVTGDTLKVVYANRTYTAPRNGDGQYVFASQPVGGNGVYESGDLANIVITVTPGTGSAGDTIEVKIPASLIPCRRYEVNTENGNSAMSVQEAYPIRVLYSVGLRLDADDLASPDDALKAYIEANKNDDGTVSFYSNAWNKENTASGLTTAVFEPADTNGYYYFTENTPLYTDPALEDPATNVSIGDTLYYEDDY